MRERRVSGEVSPLVGALARAFQQKMIEAEGEIKGRVAEPCAFGIKIDGSQRTDQNVLRTDVAVHERALGRECPMAKRAQLARKRWMRASGRAQVGIDPEGFERVVVRECGRRVWVGGASRVNEREIAPDRGGEFRLDAPREKLRLPERKVFRRKIVHHEETG